jgi:type I restriction enzyme M protein
MTQAIVTNTDYIQVGQNQGIIKIHTEGDREKITYHAKESKTYNYKDPEEKVRASYFCELVMLYGYDAKDISLEVTMPARTPSNLADIVLYTKNAHPYLVVECKKDKITDSEFNQAVEQAFGNANSLRAKFTAVVAGNTRSFYNVADYSGAEREHNILADIPKHYGKPPKYKFSKGNLEPKIVSREELIASLEKCHDTIWQGGKVAPTVAFDEVSKLLFCKLKDEKDTNMKEDVYQFQVGTNETPEKVAKRIKEIYIEAKKQDAEVFQGDIQLDDAIIFQVVEHIQGINFVGTDLDSKGVAFEKFLGDFFKGKMGQYFTPRKVIEFTVKMMFEAMGKDILKRPNNYNVLDPACGSGGFLLYALDAVRKFADANFDIGSAQWHNHWHSFAERNLYGVEINDQIARVCKMNMIIHDDGHTNVISTSSLDKMADITQYHKDFKADYFDMVLTNPPFGATIKGSETGDLLESYKLGKGKKNQKTEILFIERCIDFVKPQDGYLALVLPDGILTNSSLQYVRNFIMERCQILAVVSIPQFAFSHYGAGVKSSVVFLRRKGENETLKDYPIFMAIAERIGYDATGRDDAHNDLDEIFTQYLAFKANPANFM